jgi:hypothetical protein
VELERGYKPRWYKKVPTSAIPINQCDIPDWVKTICLIGGINV